MSDLLRRTTSEAIELRVISEAALWATLCDPHQLENAILNLVINARDAMPDGGVLTVTTTNGRRDAEDLDPPETGVAGRNMSPSASPIPAPACRRK